MIGVNSKGSPAVKLLFQLCRRETDARLAFHNPASRVLTTVCICPKEMFNTGDRPVARSCAEEKAEAL